MPKLPGGYILALKANSLPDAGNIGEAYQTRGVSSGEAERDYIQKADPYLLPGKDFSFIGSQTWEIPFLIVTYGAKGYLPRRKILMSQFKRFFGSDQDEERSPSSKAVGSIGYWFLHVVMVTFALYSGAHGINASLRYAGSSDFAKVAQIVGIITIEIVLFGVYLAFLNGKITGASQTIAAGGTFALGFALALMGIVADSQANSGIALSRPISLYLRWGLPIAPGFMALGAMLIHFLDPHTLRYRRHDQQRRDLEDYQFGAKIALEKGKAEESLYKQGLQMIAGKAVLRELEAITESAEFREAIKRTAVDKAPQIFSEAGVLMGRVTIPGEVVEESPRKDSPLP